MLIDHWLKGCIMGGWREYDFIRGSCGRETLRFFMRARKAPENAQI